MKTLFLLSLVYYFVALTTAIYYNHDYDKRVLDVIKLTRYSMEGKYYSSAETGIHFSVKSSKTSNYITVTTNSGRNLFNSSMVDQNTILISLMDRDYITLKINTPGGKRKYLTQTKNYIIPNSHKNLIEKALKLKVPLRDISMYLVPHNVDKVLANDVAKLLQVREVDLIHDAAIELGRRGLNGWDSTAAMAFYMLAMRLAKLQPPLKYEDDCTSMFTKSEQSMGFPRFDMQGRSWCKNSGRYCETCPQGEECKGMCGHKCQCWKMVCGDCCYHHGCLGHESCCDVRKPSLTCFKVFGFKCDSPLLTC